MPAGWGRGFPSPIKAAAGQAGGGGGSRSGRRRWGGDLSFAPRTWSFQRFATAPAYLAPRRYDHHHHLQGRRPEQQE